MTPRDGLLLVRKPPHVTSFRALDAVKHKVAPAKVGHTGTLDSFAEGLLVVLCGRMTKLAPFVAALPKEYEAVIRLGEETDTLDPEGEVVGRGGIPTMETIESVLPRFIGKIEQVPPAYSAVHVGGRRAYELARSGQSVDIRPRTVTIDSIVVESYTAPDLRVRVACSKGTYIRSLARDLGRACGTCAYVSELCRTRVGEFTMTAAVLPEDFDPGRDLWGWKKALVSLGIDRSCTLRSEWEGRVSTGVPLREVSFDDPPQQEGFVAAYATDGSFRALLYHKDGRFRYEIVATESVR